MLIINREDIERYHKVKCPLYQIEDIEELKLLEFGVKIKTIKCKYECERSINVMNDIKYLKKKYKIKEFVID